MSCFSRHRQRDIKRFEELYRKGNSLKLFKGSAHKILAVIMCICLVMGMSVCLTGCNFFTGLSKGFKAAQKELSKSELARIVVVAISDERNVSDAFSKIPESQLDGLSYSVFAEYCSVLRKNSQVHGTPDSFRFLTESEKNVFFNEIDANAGEQYKTIDEYGDMDVVELVYSKDRDSKAPPVRFILADNDGEYSIGGKYVNDSMFAYAFMNHYFDMIDEGNVDGLEAVIRSSYNSDIYLNSVIQAKANSIVEYYKMKVKTSTKDYELKILSPTHVLYRIPEVFTDYNDSFTSKSVSLKVYKDTNGFCILDHIPSTISEISLYKNGVSKLRMGSTYSQSEIYRLLGEPVLSTVSNDIVALAYKGVTLRFTADIKDGRWSVGKLFSVVVRNQGDFTLGEDIYVGMNVSELLLVYPMFDECNYQSSFKNVDGEFTLAFRFDDFGNVTRIDLGESVG